MQLLVFPALLLLLSTVNGEDTSIPNGTFNPLAYSVMIALPPCNYSNKNASVYIKKDNNSPSLYGNFTVPQCRPKRDLVVVSDPGNGNTATINVGYQITNLTPDTNYTVWYQFDEKTFQSVSFKTLSFKNITDIPDVFRRSGGMVVITVLLSIAMFLLLVGLIVVLVLGGRGSK